MKRLWRDTLFKRLFFLMWATLVISHLVAFGVVTGRLGFGPTMFGSIPVLPSLPPTPGLPGDPQGAGVPPSSVGPGDEPPHGPFGGEPPPGLPGDIQMRQGPSLPTSSLLLDYGIRFLIIGAAAWWGARWISTPMRRLADASRRLGQTLGRDISPPRLDERHGTVEVRDVAQVFNKMSAELDQQFRSRGLLVAAISHDLRTPLTRIRMRLEAMSEDPGAQRCITDIREMNALIDSVLEVFRGAADGEPTQDIDIHSLVQSLADDLIEQGQPVSFSGEPAIARAQPTALRRVLSNLLGNALRYGERAEVAVRRDDQGVHITIDDHGPGIPEAQLEAVFQPFYRVESSRSRHTGGTGLGLYIARDLVMRQGGTLTLTNRPGGGLRAELRLPA